MHYYELSENKGNIYCSMDLSAEIPSDQMLLSSVTTGGHTFPLNQVLLYDDYMP